MRTSGKLTENLLDNFGKILHFQSEQEKEAAATSASPTTTEPLKVMSRFSKSIETLAPDLLPLASRPKLIPKVLKIFHYVDFPSPDVSVSTMHRTAQSIAFTLFNLLKERSADDEEQFLTSVHQVSALILARGERRKEGCGNCLINL